MRSFLPSRRVWAIAEALTALLAIGLILPAPVQADCKHASDRPALGLDVGQGRLDKPSRAADQVPLPKPCSGPSCSNKSAPTPTSTPTPPPRTELWGIISDLPPLNLPNPIAWARDEASVRTIRPADPFFRPPRSPR